MNKSDRYAGDDRMDLDDPLGIAQEPVTKDDRIRASNDEESARRRRRRALGEDTEDRSTGLGLGDLDDDPFGATGIDMGGAGKGTDIKRSR